MSGERASNNRCPLCGGSLKPGVATMPFVFDNTVVLVKNVPAEVCSSCREPFVAGAATDRLTQLVGQVRQLPAEVSIVSFTERAAAPQPAFQLA